MNNKKQIELFESVSDDQWQRLADDLKNASVRICQDNDCTEDEHNCESIAYISADGMLWDICYSDYWQGWGSDDLENHGSIACICLPWNSEGPELKRQVDSNLDWDLDL